MQTHRTESTFLSAAALAFAPTVLGAWFVPRELSGYLASFRERPVNNGETRSGWVLALGAFAPFLLAGWAFVRSATGEVFAPSAYILPAALALTLWPLTLRTALHLASASRSENSQLVDACADLRGSLFSTLLFALGWLVSIGIGWLVIHLFSGLSGWAYPVAFMLTLGTLPVTWTPAFAWLSRRMDRPRTEALSLHALSRLGWLFVPSACGVFAIAILATYAPLPMHIIEDGRGVARVRGMQQGIGERGQLHATNFDLDAELWPDETAALDWLGEREDYVLRIQPRHAPAYDVRAHYQPSDAWLRTSSCGTDCENVVVQGPDWSMSLQLHEDGTRRDDTLVDRITARVGWLGVVALATMTLVLLFAALRIARVSRELRELTGANFKHRVQGQFRAERAHVVSGVLASENAHISVLDGAVELALPESLELLAADLTLGEFTQCPAVVLMNEQPAFATHRSGRTPLAPLAQVILGDPQRIEAQAITLISASVSPQVMRGLALIAVLFLAMLW